MKTITMRDAKRLYSRGNHTGMGYAPYAGVASDDTIEAAVEAAKADGWKVELPRLRSDEVVVLSGHSDGDLVAIGGDAQGHGAWAIPISDVLDDACSDEQIGALRSESGEAGDEKQVEICDRALAGNLDARAECGRVIAHARAQQ